MTRSSSLALVLVLLSSAARADDQAALVDGSQQLVVVTAASASTKTGSMQRYERSDGPWRAIGARIEVVLGNKGLGRTCLPHELRLGDKPHSGFLVEPCSQPGLSSRKGEGDGRAPAGVFALTRVFGKASAPPSGLPSAKIGAGAVCIDDVTHPAYNHIVDAATTAPAWKSAEQMVRKDALYDVVVVVDFNNAEGTTPATPKAGSCVFLHVWRAADKGTAGCTAMARNNLDVVVAWLDAAKHPLLVQFAVDDYAAQQAALHLPPLTN